MPRTPDIAAPGRLLRARLLLLVFLVSLPGTHAVTAAETARATPNEVELTRLQDALALAELRRAAAQNRSAGTAFDPLLQAAQNQHLVREWDSYVTAAHGAAEQAAKLHEAGRDLTPVIAELEQHLAVVPALVLEDVDRMRENFALPDPSASPLAQAATDAQMMVATRQLLVLYGLLAKNLRLSDRLGLATDTQHAQLQAALLEIAQGLSAVLGLARATQAAAEAQAAALPGLASTGELLAVVDYRVRFLAESLQKVAALMRAEDMDTTAFDTQVIAAIGQIDSKLLNADVLKDLLQSWRDAARLWFFEHGADALLKVLLFIAIILVTRRIANTAERILARSVESSRLKLSALAASLMLSVVKGLVMVIGVLFALSQIGFSLAPLLTGLGIAGFIVGFALQDSLSNFASGVLILIYRPYDVGDSVELGDGVSGKVGHMSLVNTTVTTFDNQTVVVPNNRIWQNVIRNGTAQHERRVDLEFRVPLDADIQAVEALLTEAATAHPKTLAEPAPTVRMNAVAPDALVFICRPWVRTPDYWDTYWELLASITASLRREGIEAPVPRQDVRLSHATNASIGR